MCVCVFFCVRVCVCVHVWGLMACEMKSSLASPQDKPHDGTIIISVSYTTDAEDICESNHSMTVERLISFFFLLPIFSNNSSGVVATVWLSLPDCEIHKLQIFYTANLLNSDRINWF